MKTLHSLAAALALFATSAASSFAAEPAPAAPVAATAKAAAPAADSDDDEAVTCEKENVTGSRVKKRTVCATKQQRAQQREQTINEMDGFRTQGTVQRSNGS